MADIDIRELVWDSINEAHIWERHQLTRELVEDACYGDPQYIKAVDTYNNRYLVIAPLPNKRILAVVLAPIGEDKYYPVSARIASKKERSAYQEWKARKEL
jgi:uncharacterized DUF497 family protein